MPRSLQHGQMMYAEKVGQSGSIFLSGMKMYMRAVVIAVMMSRITFIMSL
ncbi:MAG: hypothetical protein NVSMB54_21440 [Ktedonobacteraceae bacterium]